MKSTWNQARRARFVTATITAAATVFALTAAPLAHANPAPVHSAPEKVLEWTEMGPWGPVADNVAAASLHQGLTEDISPTGTNVACTPAAGENPVVLIHGMNSNSYMAWAQLAPELQKMGKCVYAFNVGKLGPDVKSVLGSIPIFRNMTPLDTALGELTEKIERLKAETGAQAVDIVGHSAGGTLATAYAKQQQGSGIGTIVSLAGVLHGTTLLGVSYPLEDLNARDLAGDKAASFVVSPVLVDLLKHSQFFAHLEEGGVEVPGVNYVAISTQLDEAVTPMASSQWNSPQAKNIVLQQGCSADLSGHIGLTYSPRTIALVANELGRDVEVPCQPVTGVFPDGINDNKGVRPQDLDAISDTVTAIDQRIVERRGQRGI